MIHGCDHDIQMSVLDTFEKVKCLAEDICSKPADEEEEDPTPDPPECVDPMVVGMRAGAGCRPLEAYDCLWKYKLKMKHPFAMMYLKKTCL